MIALILRHWTILFAVLLLTSLVAYAQRGNEMDSMSTISEPGPMHEHLKSLVGTWQQTVRITMAPGQPTMEGKILSKQELIFGGRFLQATGDVEFMGKTGTGLTFIGHNNLTKKYSYYNIADVGTDATFAEGVFDEQKVQFTFHGANKNPLTGGERSFRIVITVLDENEYLQENFFKESGEEEFKGVEVVSRRTKAQK